MKYIISVRDDNVVAETPEDAVKTFCRGLQQALTISVTVTPVEVDARSTFYRATLGDLTTEVKKLS